MVLKRLKQSRPRSKSDHAARCVVFLAVSAGFVFTFFSLDMDPVPNPWLDEDWSKFSRTLKGGRARKGQGSFDASQLKLKDVSNLTLPLSPPPKLHLPKFLQGYRSLVDGRPLSAHCSVCSVVSSSGQLLRFEAGPEIDAADCVIRMNACPVRGFERRVGRKTHFRIVSHSAIGNLLNSTRRLLHFDKTFTKDRNRTVPVRVLFWAANEPSHRHNALLTAAKFNKKNFHKFPP